MLHSPVDSARFQEPADEEAEDSLDAIELAADAIEDVELDVDSDDYRHACGLAIVRDIMREGYPKETDIERVIAFMRVQFSRKANLRKIYSEG